MIAPLSLFAVATTVQMFAVLIGLALICAGLIPTVGAIALTLNLPNEIRGRGIAAYVLTTALGTATAPAAIALIGDLLGGEAMLGQAVVVVSAPAGLLGAACFMLAMRGDRRPEATARA